MLSPPPVKSAVAPQAALLHSIATALSLHQASQFHIRSRAEFPVVFFSETRGFWRISLEIHDADLIRGGKVGQVRLG
jgi:hypothetical protein